jgi:RNA polymerase sigma factor (sigma-70 family)
LPADDLALLRLYAEEGNEQAFAELVSRHAEWIRSACRRSLRDKDLADDATQTVFTILARKASLLPDGTRVSGWLYRTTKFVVSDLRKREMRHRRRYNMAMRAAIERGAEASEVDNPANNGIHEFVGHVLAALPEHERQAVAMHFFDGLTFREIGEALGLSRDGAKKRVARALARLRSNFAIRSLALAAATVAAAIMRAGSTAQAVIETGANLGSLGIFEAKFLLRQMQANAKMFDKFGA